jgi:hypothetical protein
MAAPINTPLAGEIWHLSIEDLFAPVQETQRLGGDGPFVINLSVSTAPINLPPKSFLGYQYAHIFQIQVTEDGRMRYRLRLGPFASEDEADAIMEQVREIYPGALTATAGPADLRTIGALQAKLEASRPAVKKPPEKAAWKKETAALRSTPRPVAAEPAAPEIAIDLEPLPAARAAATAAKLNELWKPAKSAPAPMPPRAAESDNLLPVAALPPELSTAWALPASNTPSINPAPAMTRRPEPIPEATATPAAIRQATPILTEVVLPTPTTPVHPSLVVEQVEISMPIAAAPMRAAPSAPVLTEVVAPRKPATPAPEFVPFTPKASAPKPQVAPTQEVVEFTLKPAAPAPQVAPPPLVAAPTLEFVPYTPKAMAPAPVTSAPTREFVPYTPKAAPAPVAGAPELELVEFTPQPAAAPTPQVASLPVNELTLELAAPAPRAVVPPAPAPSAAAPTAVPKPLAPARKVAAPTPKPPRRRFFGASPKAAPPRVAAPRVAAPKVAPPKVAPPTLAAPQLVAVADVPPARPVKQLSEPLASLESNQTVRALTAPELEDDQGLRWYVIQLALSEHAFDPDAVPNLDIFSEYRLYSVAGVDQGHAVNALRLGFFSEEIAAVAVASYLAAYYEKPTIRRVSVAERQRFVDQRVEARKDVGETGKHAVIEITNDLVARYRRTPANSATTETSSQVSAQRPPFQG